MGLFSRRKSEPKKRTIVGDGIDLDPFTSYDNLGWRVVNDEQDYDALHNEVFSTCVEVIPHKMARTLKRMFPM